MTRLPLLACLCLLLASCATSKDPASPPAPHSAQAHDPTLAIPPHPWAKQRTQDAKARLAKSAPGLMIWEAIEAHGGLEEWFLNGPVRFQFRYQPVDPAKEVRDTVQVVDTWSSLAMHTVTQRPELAFGWDGTKAWKSSEEVKENARFWSLTPFYFIAIPFVLADPGVLLAPEGTATFEDTTYDLVRATFSPGTGDSPEDYYVVYLDQQTRRVAGVRYVVTYKGFFPDGGSTPEKFMKYDGQQSVDGITFAQTFRTFAWNPETQTVADLVTTSTLSQLSFLPTTKKAIFSPPQGAIVMESY